MQRSTIIHNVAGWACGMPAAMWYQLVQTPKTCRMIKRAGKGADLQSVMLCGVSLPGVCLQGANLSKAHLMRVDLHGADLSNANLSSAVITNSNLQEARLHRANLVRSSLAGTNFRDADLTGADLTGAMLLRLDHYVPQKLMGEAAALHWAGPDLSGANLTGAILIGADLLDADLTGAKLTGVRADVRTRWPEGFNPEWHGIEIPPLPVEWQLKQGEIVLGTLLNCRSADLGSGCRFQAAFAPTVAFGKIQPHFEEMARCVTREWSQQYLEAYEPIRVLGLTLESPDGEIVPVRFLHIEAGEARFNY